MKATLKTLACILVCTALLSACGGEKMYYSYDMTDFITVGEYSGEVDCDSEEFDDYKHSFYKDTFGNDLQTQILQGDLRNRDSAKLEYAIYFDGKKYSETENIGVDIVVGSEGFVVRGFEKALIGAEIGFENVWETTLSNDFFFPELAGKDVEVRYTVYYALRYGQPSDDVIKKYGYDSVADYNKAADDFAVSVYLFNQIYDATTFNSYPAYETEVMLQSIYDGYKTKKGMTPAQVAALYNWTEAELRENLTEGIHKTFGNMPRDLVSYYILQKYDAELTEEDLAETRAEIEKKVEGDILSAGYTEIEAQRMAAYLKALDLLLNNHK
jgi:hypothetical protein